MISNRTRFRLAPCSWIQTLQRSNSNVSHTLTHTHTLTLTLTPHTHSHTHTRSHTRTHTHSHSHTHTLTHTHTHTHTHTLTHTHSHTHTHIPLREMSYLSRERTSQTRPLSNWITNQIPSLTQYNRRDRGVFFSKVKVYCICDSV